MENMIRSISVAVMISFFFTKLISDICELILL